jgi:hypothetical protein
MVTAIARKENVACVLYARVIGPRQCQSAVLFQKLVIPVIMDCHWRVLPDTISHAIHIDLIHPNMKTIDKSITIAFADSREMS